MIPSEAAEQEALFRWAAYKSAAYPELRMLFHIPNGGSRNKIEAANLKRQGVKAGVPDIFLAVPRGGYHGLFIEMKRQHGGRVSEDQREWIDALNAQGYMVAVCRGFEEAKNLIERYMRKGEGNEH